jgi:predicted dehydrogenase
MNWGILATGTIAAKFAATVNAMEDESETLQAVASRSLEKAQDFAKEHGIAHAFDSYEVMAESDCIDAVYIATPNQMHYENAKMCLMAGKHVLCEKPFTTDTKQASELYALAEEKGLFIMEAFWIRFLPVLVEMRRMIQSGMIGEVVFARSDYGFIANGARKQRKFASELGGGALLDIGIYNLGFMQMAMGQKPVSFTSDVHMNEAGTDEFSVIRLKYQPTTDLQEPVAVVTTSIGMELARNAVVAGTKGTITIPDFQKAEKMTVRLYNGEQYDVEIPFDVNGFEYEIREVSRCVAESRISSDIFTPKMSMQTLQLMDDIRKSWGMKFSFEK